jgi:hypothetical protein
MKKLIVLAALLAWPVFAAPVQQRAVAVEVNPPVIIGRRTPTGVDLADLQRLLAEGWLIVRVTVVEARNADSTPRATVIYILEREILPEAK